MKKRVSKYFFIALSFLAFLTLVSATAIKNYAPSERLIIDLNECISCGFCEEVAPECIIIHEGIPRVLVGWHLYPDQYHDAIDICPMEAISLEYY